MSARKLALIAGAWLTLMAPTPGSIGSCGGSDHGGDPADFKPYCEQRGQLICVRRYLRKELTKAERDACRWQAIDTCKLSGFPSDCHPTQRKADTCLNALESLDTLQTKEAKLSECTTQTLCGKSFEPPPSAADASADEDGGQ
ncbi:MAG TPA: hypothetical protein VHM19_05260 [Polyangiales bacterium]|jgi:hypothetical protein|nr:hypothetical protein [Polyangiales bacterium]